MKIDVKNFTINDYLGRTFECDCHKKHTTCLEHVNINTNVKEDIVEYLKQHDYHSIYLIEDENTYRVYGKELETYLKMNSISCDIVVLEGDVVPDEMTVFKIIAKITQKYDYIIGVGSGTLNDLSKFISYKLSLDYAIVATAPSMDGYASIGAALISDNLKTTYDCHVPTAIFGDLDVLAQAPIDMIKAGLGDVVGKYNCLVDWKIAHIINDEYYCQTIVDMVYKSIQDVVNNADGVLARDKKAVKAISEALIATGMA
ncbi:MAG: iron-containing alcohol dehydrogenase, partial [Anaerorhabdus sp.]